MFWVWWLCGWQRLVWGVVVVEIVRRFERYCDWVLDLPWFPGMLLFVWTILPMLVLSVLSPLIVACVVWGLVNGW